MSNPETLASATSNIPAYARALPTVSLCSSILFAVISVVTWISLLTISSYDILIAFLIGMPLSLGGSIFLAFLPTVILRFFVNDPRVRLSLWISGVSATIGGGTWIFIATVC
jgi:hypothetical protein